jgi:hypothetical protein
VISIHTTESVKDGSASVANDGSLRHSVPKSSIMIEENEDTSDLSPKVDLEMR